MHHACRVSRGTRAPVFALEKGDAQAAQSGITRDARAVDASANDGQVILHLLKLFAAGVPRPLRAVPDRAGVVHIVGMILKRYGSILHSVTPNFDARAMNEIGFQRSHEASLDAGEFEAGYERVEVHELRAQAEGFVQMDTEERVLAQLREQLDHLIEHDTGDQLLLVENEQGRDYPKLREKITNAVIEGENKLHFHRTVDPPLRIGVYAPRHR